VTPSENVYQALVDPPNDRTYIPDHGGDDFANARDIGIVNSTRADLIFVEDELHALTEFIKEREQAQAEHRRMLYRDLSKFEHTVKDAEESHTQLLDQILAKLDGIITDWADTRRAEQTRLLAMESKLDNLLQQSETTKHIHDDLLEAHHALHEENAQLRTTIDQLMRQIGDLYSPPPPLSPITVTDTSSAVEEMSLQLYGVQKDI
jgi:DNA repair exonuclease SbcCD ATPase subunit